MPVSMRGQIRFRTDWSVVDTKASAFDHVYAALIVNSDAAEHLLVQLLRKPPLCSQFIESLSSLNRFDLLETCLQVRCNRLLAIVKSITLITCVGKDPTIDAREHPFVFSIST
jgi:hypothetical protein